MSRPLWEKLQRLQCHFTWDLEVKDRVQAKHTQQTLDVYLKQERRMAPRIAYLSTRAYVCSLEGSFKEALASLKEAEKVLRNDDVASFSRQVLVAYGNYAWIYYHLADYDRVDSYLDRIQTVCHSLSSPEPYSAQIPEIYEQKGWSLLAVGFRNSELATECFQKALEQNEASAELQEALTFSKAVLMTHNWDDDLQKECVELLERLLRSQPQNYEAKVYLASALHVKDHEKALQLADDVVQNSLNPEFLRRATKVYRSYSLPQAVSTLKKAIALEPDYYLLHYDLGLLYMDCLHHGPVMSKEEREQMEEDGIECFKRSLEGDPHSIYSRLKLATMYRGRAPDYEEEIYLNVMERLPRISKRCQQAFYLHWGDFLLHSKKQKEEALKAYEAACKIQANHPLEQKQLVKSLRTLAKVFQQERKTEQARVTFSLLCQMGFERAGTWRAASNGEEDPAGPSQEEP